MRNPFRAISFLLMLVFAVSFFFKEPVAIAENEKAKIAVIAPLSGEAASVGAAVTGGITLALEKLPSELKDKIEIVYEDDRLDPKQTIAAYHRLCTAGKPSAVLTISSGTSKALAPLVERDQVPTVAIASDPQINGNRNWVVNFWVKPEVEAELAINEAVKRGYRKVARIVSIQDGYLSIKAAFDKYNNSRLEFVVDEEYPPDIKDFKPFLTKVRAKKDLDAVFVSLLPGQLGIFAKQLRQQGITLPMAGVEGFADPGEVEASGGALVGQWFIDADDPNDTFLKEYFKRFPGQAYWGAGNAHDAVLLLAAAIEKDPTHKAINTFLHTVKDFSGALGTFSADGANNFTLAAAVKIVTPEGTARKLSD